MTSIYTRIVITIKEEDEPLYVGEIACVLESHWFVVKKALDMMVDGGMIRACETCNAKGTGVRYELT